MSHSSPDTSETPTIASRPLRVLYADDVRELRRLLEISLGNDGHRVETFADGREAFERVFTGIGDFDVIITDHHMPNMNGLEFVARLRELPYTGKVLVFSSELSEEVSAAYRELRADFILQKPVIPSVLRRILAGF